MSEVALARLWQLPDGTRCLLLKDSTGQKWEVRVERQGGTLRSELFGSPIVAMEEGKHWRSSFDRSFQTSS